MIGEEKERKRRIEEEGRYTEEEEGERRLLIANQGETSTQRERRPTFVIQEPRNKGLNAEKDSGSSRERGRMSLFIFFPVYKCVLLRFGVSAVSVKTATTFHLLPAMPPPPLPRLCSNC